MSGDRGDDIVLIDEKTLRKELLAALPLLEALTNWQWEWRFTRRVRKLLRNHLPALLATVRECEELRTRVAKDSRHQKREQWAVLETERDALRAENERLRVEVKTRTEVAKEDYAEIERLRGELENLRAYIDPQHRYLLDAALADVGAGG